MGDLGVIVIDMQKYFLKMDDGARHSLIEANRQLLGYCAKNDVPVIMLEYLFWNSGKTVRPIRRAFAEVPTGARLDKRHDNGFKNTLVEQAFKEVGVKTICFAGVNAASCVRQTAQGALKAGFEIMTARDLIANGRYFGPEPFEDQYGRWYKDHGKFLNSYADITGGQVVEPLPTPEGFWTRLRNAFV